MQGKGRVEDIDGPHRKKSPVERAGDSGGKVGTVVVGSKAFLHANPGVIGQHRRKQLEESVEVIAGKVGEESRKLRRVEA